MHIKELFTVPEGLKVTEKVFSKVLLSSICSILLCMACLAGTTWAWFVVGIENSDNEIQLVTVSADVTVNREGTQMGETADGSYSLEQGDYTVTVEMKNEAKRPAFLVMTVTQNGTTRYYGISFAAETEDMAKKQLLIKGAPATVSFSTGWGMPVDAVPFDDSVVIDFLAPEPASAETEQPTLS